MLLKGFEVEAYTGTPDGDIVGLSDRITANLDNFVREPDSRNVEYITPPRESYERLLCDLVTPRLQLRRYLKTLGNYTIIPGSTLSLGDSKTFYRSDPTHPYHDYIEHTYGTRVVTASIHINVGISDPEDLIRACRLLRVEAPLYLALSASSPFLDGQPTGYHSTRWGTFPQTPEQVPLFTSHIDHIRWVERQLALGTMQNVRHLWTSVRPNGDRRPYDLNRLELRICDLVTDSVSLLAITALLEARLHQLLANPELDPLQQSELPGSSRADDLLEMTSANEMAVAKYSLDATLRHWRDGREILAKDWIQEIYGEVMPIAKQNGFRCFLSPLQELLAKGNTAQQWLRLYDKGLTPRQILQGAIIDIVQQEQELSGNFVRRVRSPRNAD
ncbi:MAG: glutamate--cysteine ligase [Synechococcales cyanobacterium RU_4_20]|nr:glutamate--cysteine ligase [Synechococcales cyanobacterium RU_4_20]